MSRPIIITQEELGYVSKDIYSGVASQGKTIDEAVKNLQEALELYYDGKDL